MLAAALQSELTSANGADAVDLSDDAPLHAALRSLSLNHAVAQQRSESGSSHCILPNGMLLSPVHTGTSCDLSRDPSIPASPLARTFTDGPPQLTTPSADFRTPVVTPLGTPTPSPCSRRSSTAASPNSCAICLSPIQKRRGGGGAPGRQRFQMPCCRNSFHRDCLARHKQCSAGSPTARHRGCPLCRSVQPTGLTPASRQPPQVSAAGGFVSGGALHNEMCARRRQPPRLRSHATQRLLHAPLPVSAHSGLSGRLRRVAAARSAVQRGLAARATAAPPPSASGTPPFSSPGAAYLSVLAADGRAPPPPE